MKTFNYFKDLIGKESRFVYFAGEAGPVEKSDVETAGDLSKEELDKHTQAMIDATPEQKAAATPETAQEKAEEVTTQAETSGEAAGGFDLDAYMASQGLDQASMERMANEAQAEADKQTLPGAPPEVEAAQEEMGPQPEEGVAEKRVAETPVTGSGVEYEPTPLKGADVDLKESDKGGPIKGGGPTMKERPV
jgi:hypothetical protein